MACMYCDGTREGDRIYHDFEICGKTLSYNDGMGYAIGYDKITYCPYCGGKLKEE